MREYELITVLSPILSEEEGNGAWERLRAVITQDGGTITYEERWGMRRLAYPIRKGSQRFLEGNYHLTRFEAENTSTRQVEAHLRLAENILRYLLVNAELPIPKAKPAEVQREVAEEVKPAIVEAETIDALEPTVATNGTEEVAALEQAQLEDTAPISGEEESVTAEVAEELQPVDTAVEDAPEQAQLEDTAPISDEEEPVTTEVAEELQPVDTAVEDAPEQAQLEETVSIQDEEELVVAEVAEELQPVDTALEDAPEQAQLEETVPIQDEEEPVTADEEEPVVAEESADLPLTDDDDKGEQEPQDMSDASVTETETPTQRP